MGPKRLVRIISPILSLIVSATMFLTSGARAADNDNLLVNGDFALEQNGLPSGWKTFALPGCGSRFAWRNDHGAAPELEINNSEPNESTIAQSIILDPGWYRLSAEVRTEDVSKRGGAYLYLAPQDASISLTTSPVRGSKDWRKLQLLFKTAIEKRALVIGCRLGLPNGPATGAAFFRGLSLVRVIDPPNAAAFQDIDRLWQMDLAATAPRGPASWATTHSLLGRWGVAALFGLLILTALSSWRLLIGLGTPPSNQRALD